MATGRFPRKAVRLKGGHRRERRKDLRLRTLVDEFKAGINQNRRDLELQFTRMAQIQAELDALKRTHAKK